MNHRRRRGRFVAAATIGFTAISAALTLGVGAASAGGGPYSVPTGVGPRWDTGHVQQIRNAGSDTTFFLTQTIGNLYEQSGLYGCNLDGAVVPDYSSCLNAPGDLSATTDTQDNYDHVEVVVGLGKIGSGDGQKQLCAQSPPIGTTETATFPVDYARSSKPASQCSTLVQLGFAKDGVPALDFPGAEGPGTAVGGTTPWAGVSGGIVGPVAAGWLPGDPVTCDTGAANSSTNALNRTTNPNVGILADSCSGVPFESVSNVGGTSSTAYELWCATDSTRITDWGQLTNLTGVQTPGQGTAIGVPITIVGVNTGSGTEATFTTFVNSSSASGACSGSSGNMDANGFTHAGYSPETGVLENNAAQLGDFATADFTGADATQAADQAALTATSLYMTSNGVYNSNIHSRIVTLSNGSQYAANKMLENDVVPTTTLGGTLLTNTFPTARTLYNIYRSDTVRGSTAGFLNWFCDANNVFTKGKDLYTGKNYDTEITTAINTTYGFIRLTDLTVAPNNSCQEITSVAFPNS
jgi:hypothetical protein